LIATTQIPEPLTYDRAIDLAHHEHGRFHAVLELLGDADWSRPTDCDAWTVRDIAGHVLGSMHTNASVWRAMCAWERAKRAARRNNTDTLTESTAAQVRAFADLAPRNVATTFERLAARNVRGRRRIPSIVRRTPITISEKHYSLGYITGIVLTRDVWMHRIDLCRATGHEVVLTTEHDGCIIRDIVGDWARGHGQAFVLELDGPARGTWATGTHGPTLNLDAVEFCRILSGRAPAAGLLTKRVLF
jgi:uncharacterized protein (TIGR03083 family)